MKKNWIIWGLLGLMAIISPACSKDEPVDEAKARQELLEKQNKEIVAYLETNGLDAQKDNNGIYRTVLQEDAGGEPVEQGDIAVVHYKISRLDGTLIATTEADKPVWIAYSTNNAYSYFPYALYFGLNNVKVGGSYRYYVPSAYAYSKYTNNGTIAENSIIVLEYQIVDVYHFLEEIVEAEDAIIKSWLQAENQTADSLDNGLRKIELTAGTGDQVVSGDTVNLYYKGYYLNKEVFDENTSGDGFEIIVDKTGLVSGFTQAIKTMKVGEKSLFILPSELAYGRRGAFVAPQDELEEFKEKGFIAGNVLSIPPYSTLIFEIELRSKK